LILAGFAAFKEYTLRFGTEIRLKTIPVDPRDLFRGDYVILHYTINNIAIESLPIQIVTNDFKVGETVYVTLKLDQNRIAQINDISQIQPEEHVLFIRGKVSALNNSALSVKYGIENYFVPEGTGREIEKRTSSSYVKVKIDRFGNAVIKSLE
jgi:uncharacterized membrane-anchored protein